MVRSRLWSPQNLAAIVDWRFVFAAVGIQFASVKTYLNYRSTGRYSRIPAIVAGAVWIGAAVLLVRDLGRRAPAVDAVPEPATVEVS